MKSIPYILQTTVLIGLVALLNCTRPSTINFINMGMVKQIGFNPKGIRFGLGVAINGRAIELGGTFLIRIDSLEISKMTDDSLELLWKIKSNNNFSPGLIEYGKTPSRFTQIFPLNSIPIPIKNNEIIKAIFSYKSIKDTITGLYDDNASTIVLKTKKRK